MESGVGFVFAPLQQRSSHEVTITELLARALSFKGPKGPLGAKSRMLGCIVDWAFGPSGRFSPASQPASSTSFLPPSHLSVEPSPL